MDLQVKDNKGKVVGSLEASDYVWAADSNHAVLHQAVVALLANRRQGNHQTMTRGDSLRTTRKLGSLKGGGRARHGSRSSPTMVGGGVAHGPHPRSYRQRLPKKMRRMALRIALSEKLRDDSVVVLDALSFETARTKELKSIVDALELRGKTLIITDGTDKIVTKSVANLPGVDTLPAGLLNPLAATSATNLIFTRDAVKVVDTLWGAAPAEGSKSE